MACCGVIVISCPSWLMPAVKKDNEFHSMLHRCTSHNLSHARTSMMWDDAISRRLFHSVARLHCPSGVRQHQFSAVMRLHVVCLFVSLSVRLWHSDTVIIGSNSSKIISRPNSLRPMRLLTPTWAIWCNGNTPKIRVELGWGQEHIKSCEISETVQDRTKVTITPLRTNGKSHACFQFQHKWPWMTHLILWLVMQYWTSVHIYNNSERCNSFGGQRTSDNNKPQRG